MKRFRRYFQISLRTVLIVITCFCILLGWFANGPLRQERAVRALREAGGSVSYDYQYDENGEFDGDAQPGIPNWIINVVGIDTFCNVEMVSFWDEQEDDDIFPHLIQIPNLKRLSLQYTSVTDAGISNLRKLPRLKELDLYHTYVTDEGLQHLSELTQLEELRFGEVRVTGTGFSHLRKLESLRVLDISCSLVGNVGLEHLRGHPNIRKLHLSYSEVDDNGLVYLKDLPNLEYVDFYRMNVSDAGLKHLEDCKNLRRVIISGHTGVTEKGVKELGQALPNCKIEADYGWPRKVPFSP